MGIIPVEVVDVQAEETDHLAWGKIEWIGFAVITAAVLAFAVWSARADIRERDEGAGMAYTITVDYPAPSTTIPAVFTCEVSDLQGVLAGDTLTVELMPVGTIGSLVLSGGETSADVDCDASAAAGMSGLDLVVTHRTGAVVNGTGSTGANISVSSWAIRFGEDAADAALWDNAAKHKWSKFGALGGLYDVDAATTIAPDESPPIDIIGYDGGESYADYKVRLKLGAQQWAEADLLFGWIVDEFTDPYGGSYWLPYSAEEGDTWEGHLGSAGAKTITVQIIRKSDSSIMAEDTAQFTMFVPEVVIDSPSGNVSDVFDITWHVSEWYSGGSASSKWKVTATPSGGDPTTLSTPTHPAGDPAGSVSYEVDLQFDQYGYKRSDAIPAGAFDLDVSLIRGLSESRVTGTAALTHVETYSISITAPSDGAELPAAAFSGCQAALAQGCPVAGDTITWYYRRSGIWHTAASQAYTILGQYVRGLPETQIYFGGQPVDEDRLKIVWAEGDGTERASDEVSITLEDAVSAPPEPDDDGPTPGPTPDPDDEPVLDWVLPPDGGTVSDDFTGTLDYSGYHAGTATLTIYAVGASTVTLYDASVTLTASAGTLMVALDFGGAAEGAYTLIATIANSTYSESASDAVSVTLASAGPSDDPPDVEITSPEDGASVTGSVSVDVTATDDVSVYSVVLYVDGAFVQRLDAPNNGTAYRFTWDSTTYANGSHVLLAKAWDSSLQTDTDSVTVNLVNAQADLERVLFTKQLGYSGGSPINAESARFRDRDFKRALLVVEWPDEADLPTDPRNKYNVFCGYHCPGTATDFDDFTIIQEARSFKLPTSQRSIRFAMKAVPQRTVAYWEVACAQAIRLAANSSGDVLALCTTPHSVQRVSRQSGEVIEVADLSSLASAPADMVCADGKVFVAYADRVLVLDEDTDDLGFELLLPWTDGVTSITALATDGSTVWIAADLDAGGSGVYEYTYPSARLAASHDQSVTALQYMLSGLYVGDDTGQILQLGSGSLSLLFSTGETSITRFGVNSQTLYAGTSTDGKIFYRPASWGASWDSGWTAATGLAAFDGWMYAGGTGTGATYLWYEALAGAWAQTLNLDNCTQVNDLLSVEDTETGHDQLFVATTGIAGTTRIYRVEKSPESDYVCSVDPPHFVGQILKD